MQTCIIENMGMFDQLVQQKTLRNPSFATDSTLMLTPDYLALLSSWPRVFIIVLSSTHVFVIVFSYGRVIIIVNSRFQGHDLA